MAARGSKRRKPHLYVMDPIHFARWIPEIARLPDDQERKWAWRTASSHGWRSVWVWLIPPFALLLGWVIRPYVHALPDDVRRDLATPLAAIIAFAAWVAMVCAAYPRFRRTLRREVASRGVPICHECGHDLAAAPSDRCPECGTERLTPPEPVEDSQANEPPHL